MTLIESKPYERVVSRGEFIKPMAITNQVEFTLKSTSSTSQGSAP
jgi:hypothetical protein